jgi:hydrogenase maturation protein HypF
LNPLAYSIELPVEAPARVLACGAYLKNRACLLDGRLAHWSALHGDLDSADHRMALSQSVETLQALAGGPIQAIAHDLHPDFYSTQVAQTLAQQLGVPAIAVQHHHAHIAVGIAELGIVDAVVGVALDGMGWGTDASAWGGEVLWLGGTGQAQHWLRLAHLPALALPGGDAAAREPWRMAASVLYALGRGSEIEARFGEVAGISSARLVHTLLQRQLNCPQSTSAGRWFDAAAGALGICAHQTHEAQAAIALEQMAARWLERNHTDAFTID